MHTFFINTTGTDLRPGDRFLEIPQETRQLLFLNCPLSSWMDETDGYRNCVCRIVEQIDSYEDVDNCFHLILYVDLFSVRGIAVNSGDEDWKKISDLQVVYTLVMHYMKSTIIEYMKSMGLEPEETVLLIEACTDPLGETRDMKEYGVKQKYGKLIGLLHWPEGSELTTDTEAHLAVCGEGDEMQPETFLERVNPKKEEELLPGLDGTLTESVEMFLLKYKESQRMEDALEHLLRECFEQYDSECADIVPVTFVTGQRNLQSETAGNRKKSAERRLRLAVYLMACVEHSSLFLPVNPGVGSTERYPRQIPSPDLPWDMAVCGLHAKKRRYEEELEHLNGLREKYSELDLAPKLYKFSHDLFGLNEFGTREKVFTVQKTQPSSDTAQLVLSEKERSFLLREGEYTKFDAKCDGTDSVLLQKNVEPEQYIAEAGNVRQYHLQYWQALKAHMVQVLSGYTSRSRDGRAPLIPKRKVSVAEEGTADPARDYRYSIHQNVDNRAGEVQKNLAENAYRTVQTEYLQFCAARPMCLTDPEEQCNWLVTRIQKISGVLRRLRKIALGTGLALPVIFLPHAVIQWNAITAGLTPFAVFAASAAVPVVLLYSVFGFVSAAQKKKYRQAWETFRKRSNQILEENSKAAQMYDQLLGIYIPSVKWVYEYKIDVAFYMECCAMAEAKIKHHREKLSGRVQDLDNILEDLDAAESSGTEFRAASDNGLDYNVSFCTGKDNRTFYSILTHDLLDVFYNERMGHFE